VFGSHFTPANPRRVVVPVDFAGMSEVATYVEGA